MGPSKRAGKATVVPVARNTRNRTRLHKTKLFTDPAQSTLQLTNQLRGLGLYAAPTLGDGNCLFRALADQLWGSPNGHMKLREEICDWMVTHKERYEGFVDEDRSFDTHIRCMRIPGTYGGHLELSAFAHLKRRNVKVIQPGLVYVIEWSCGWTSDMNPPVVEAAIDESTLNERDRRRLRRDKVKLEKQDVAETPEESGAVYVAYHDWEHFSSVRNLAGPHTGPPIVVERPESVPVVPSPATPKRKGKAPITPRGKGKEKVTALAVAAAAVVPLPLSTTPASSTPDDTLLMPCQVPLPPSRSVSPLPPLSHATTTASTSSTASSSLSPPTPPDSTTLGHLGRSPKRTFDDSEETLPSQSQSQPSPAKRHKRPTSHPKASAGASPHGSNRMDVDEADENTPSLSEDSSHSSPTSDTSSALSSPEPSPPPVPPPVRELEPEPEPGFEPESESPSRPLTRRQRKALGLPHPRTVALASAAKAGAKAKANTNTGAGARGGGGGGHAGVSAGKIVIPGGRRGGLRSAGKVEADVGEWRTNGTGRLDVRGFRELKI
ncbi:hypothetical protein BU17DRAFT_88368 [Hysterangium stoloniferum]|nr:hypothetical protein BU17DRAFT_88368 [Hysterangium stoloniferum]